MPETDINDVYREFIDRLMAEKNLSHKVVCKQADISYSHSRAVLAGRSNVGEKSLYKLLYAHYSRKFAVETIRDRIGYDYKAGIILDDWEAKPAEFEISGLREALFICKLVALEKLPIDVTKAMLGSQFDEIVAKFTELEFCQISGGTILASPVHVEVFGSSALKEMAKMIVSLTNAELEFNVQQAWTAGLNKDGLQLVKKLILKFVNELLEIFNNPAYRGNDVFSIALNSTIL
ncbi:MAG: hypothetical protein M3Q07_09325 [Pseudobdellovibrionaceae bacterium]|nr:hypothetical protein [Pseudobdellovibrionaceae bacterium]